MNGDAARKTRCDGVHPSCGSCARRSLPCNYVNDREGSNPKGRPKAMSQSTAGSSVLHPQTSPIAQTLSLNGNYNGYVRQDARDTGEQDLKRNLDVGPGHPNKKMRVTDDLSSGMVAVSQMP